MPSTLKNSLTYFLKLFLNLFSCSVLLDTCLFVLLQNGSLTGKIKNRFPSYPSSLILHQFLNHFFQLYKLNRPFIMLLWGFHLAVFYSCYFQNLFSYICNKRNNTTNLKPTQWRQLK